MTVAPHRQGILFILVAPAGAGKNTLLNVAKTQLDHLRQLPTATTRAIREGEAHGREHLFISMEAFQQLIRDNALLEYQEVHGRYYGVPRATVEDAINSGEDLIADIEYLGATQIRNIFPDNVVLIYIQPPSIRSLVERMRIRGEAEPEIGKRLMRVAKELEYAEECDYLIINDNMERASELLHSIIQAERNKQAIRQRRKDHQSYRLGLEYAGAALITSQQQLLYHHHLGVPTATLNTDEQPHSAAIRALYEQLSIKISPEDLITGGAPTGEFLPPRQVSTTQVNGKERVIMYYLYNPQQPFTPPTGWQWVSKATIPTEDLNLITWASELPSQN